MLARVTTPANSPASGATGDGRRPRKRGEARQAILTSARTLFGANGYTGTNMREVADHAEVSEALLYRYFPSKTALFAESVIEPYHGFVEQYLERWETLDHQLSNDEMVHGFVSGLYDFILEHRELLSALVTANRFGDGDIDETGALSQEVKRLADFTAREAGQRGLTSVDLEMAVSCTIAMIFAIALLDDVLFAKGAEHPTKQRLVEQMSLYATAGIQQRQGDNPATSGS
jgi:AcrR family transcriptional regulator